MISNPPKDLISAPQDPTLWSSVKWIYSFPLKDIEARLAQNYAAIGALKSVEPVELSPSGRILAIRFNGKKDSVALPFEEANFILAAGTLRSNFFYMLPFGRGAKPAEYLFVGTDTGLGEGLCSDGAAGMARAGKTAREILKHYYPDLQTSK
jgi:SpoIID/LytB domain protein